MNKKDKVLILSSIILAGFIIAVFFHYILGFYLNSPYNTFLFYANQFFDDFTGLIPKLVGFAPYSPPSDWQQYFPLSYLVLTPFAYIKNKLFASVVFGLIFVSFFVYWNIKELACENLDKTQNFRNIFIMTFLSYPFLYVLDRGNFDMIIFIFFTFFVHALYEGKYKKAAILLGVVNAFKPFSFLFPVVFLFEKKYREFFLCVGISLMLILGGFLCFKGNILYQMHILYQSWDSAQNDFVISLKGGLNNSSSLFMALKLYFCVVAQKISPFVLSKIYNWFTIIFTLVTIFFAYREKVFWKRISLLTLYMLAIPTVVFDYKLILLFAPLWLFINNNEKSKFDLIYLVMFGLLLIPKKFMIIHYTLNAIQLGVLSVWLNPLIMLAFMGLIIYEQFLVSKRGKTNGQE